MIRLGDFAPDESDLNTGIATVADNVIPTVTGFAPFYGFGSVASALTAACKGAVAMRDNDGNNYIFAGDATKLYGMVSGVPTDYSKVGGYTSNLEKWQFIRWGAKCIASKFGDTPQIITLSNTTFADLTGSPPQGRTLSVIGNFVVLGNTWDSTDGNKTNRVQWSGFEDETQWTPGSDQSDFQDIQGNGGDIKRIIGGEYGVVFQEYSIWRMDYVGTPLVFQFDEVERGRGTPSGESVVQVGGDTYYLGQDGFYVLKNGSQSLSIGANKVDKWFYGQLNEGFTENIYGAFDPERGLVVWAYPSTDSTTGTCDRLIMYNIKSQKWSTATADTEVIFQGASTAYTLEDLDVFGNIDTMTISLDDPAWQGGAYKIGVFDDTHKFGFFAGNALAGTVETGEQANDTKTLIKGVRPITDATATVKIKYRDTLDATASETSYSTESDGEAKSRVHARYANIQLITSGDYTYASGVEIDSVKRGRR